MSSKSQQSPSLGPGPAKSSPLLGPATMAPTTTMQGSLSPVPVVSPQGSFVATSVCRLLHAPAIATVLAGVAAVMLLESRTDSLLSGSRTDSLLSHAYSQVPMRSSFTTVPVVTNQASVVATSVQPVCQFAHSAHLQSHLRLQFSLL